MKLDYWLWGQKSIWLMELLTTLKEKGAFLKRAEAENYVLFLEHDAVNECCTLKDTERGIRLDNTFDFNSMF